MFEIRHRARAPAASRPREKGSIDTTRRHCRSDRLGRRFAARSERTEKALFESHAIWPETCPLMQVFWWLCSAAAMSITRGRLPKQINMFRRGLPASPLCRKHSTFAARAERRRSEPCYSAVTPIVATCILFTYSRPSDTNPGHSNSQDHIARRTASGSKKCSQIIYRVMSRLARTESLTPTESRSCPHQTKVRSGARRHENRGRHRLQTRNVDGNRPRGRISDVRGRPTRLSR